MTMEERVAGICSLLDTEYPFDIKCFLDYTEPYQLLIATILSAQCTDARVNIVTKDLFAKYTTIEAFANAKLEEMEQDIHSTGFYHNKAQNIIGSMRYLLSEHGGEMPSDMDALLKFPGVGRKTANLMRSHIFNIPGIVVDTHVGRISKRLGLTESTDPTRIEYDLLEILPREHWIRYNTQIITFGRAICRARSPLCKECQFTEYCTM